MTNDTRPLLKILPWLLVSAAAHAVLLVNWPSGDQPSSASPVLSGRLQVQLIRGVNVVAESRDLQPIANPASAQIATQTAPAVVDNTARQPRPLAAQGPSISIKPLPPAMLVAAITEARPSSPTSTVSHAASTSTGGDADIHSAEPTDLMALLHQAIDRNKRYPQSALRMGREGSTRVDFKLSPSGQIEDLNVGTSSGVQALDIAATRAVQNIAPFAAADRYLDRTQQFQVDVVFRIN